MLRTGSRRHRESIIQTNHQTTIQRKTTRRFKKPPQPITDVTNTVNLSNKHLNQHHISVPNKGLSFCPTPRPTHPCHQLRDAFLFNCRIRLKHHFAHQQLIQTSEPDTSQHVTQNNIYKKFQPSSGWTPPAGRDLFLDCFAGNIVNKVDQLKSNSTRKNLTEQEIEAYLDLKNDTSIVIKPADKGGATVILNRTDYIAEAKRQLSNETHYKRSNLTEFEKSAVEVKTFLTNYVKNGHLPPYTHLHLTHKFPRLPQLYLLPKIHKRNNPGRPIISAVGCPTEKISAFVDSTLRPLVLDLPSFIKDTTDFIQKIQQVRIEPNHCLLTIDVSSLYTNIPHNEGLKACRDALLTRDRDEPHTWFILTLLRFVLTLNYFAFNDEIYHQISGTAMGTKLAPNYANIFMGKLEQQLIDSYPVKPTIWLRFIDDIFCIFPGNLQETQKYVDHLNNQHPTIKFTAEISNQSVNFLDTTVTRETNGSLSTNLYRKPTDTFKYLHYRSYHPSHQKRSIPYSQFVRIRRICTHKRDYFTNTDLMIRHFISRGYPMKLLIKAQTDAASLVRSELLKPKTRSETETVPFITTYGPAHQDIKNILQSSLFLLDNSRPPINNKYKFLVTARRCPNLRDLLTQSKLPSTTAIGPRSRGCKPCQRPRCTVCKHVKTTTSVKSHSTGRNVTIPATTTCTSVNIIYIIECRRCGIQYVGQTSNTLIPD